MRKVAIVGTHPDSRNLAPFKDKSYEIWVFNEAAQQEDWCTRWDAVIQLHLPEVYRSSENFVRTDHWDWLKRRYSDGKRIIMQDVDPDVPNSVKYPLEEIQGRFLAGINPNYLKSSIDFAIALALYENYQQIHIWGVELWSNTEYSYQAESYRFWVGFAKGMSMYGDTALILHSSQDLFAGKLYGYHANPVIEQSYFEERAAELEPMWKDADKKLHDTRRDLDRILEGKRMDRISDATKACQNAALETGELAGALAEAERYAQRTDPIPRQEFERACAKAQRTGEEKRVLMYHEGGKVEYVWNVWMQTGRIEALNQVRFFVGNQMQLAYDTGAYLGGYRENWKYMLEIDSRIMAGGHVKTSDDPYQFKPEMAIVR